MARTAPHATLVDRLLMHKATLERLLLMLQDGLYVCMRTTHVYDVPFIAHNTVGLVLSVSP